MDCHVSYEINGVVYTIQRDKINKSRLLNALLHNDGKMKVVKNETGAYIINRDNAFFPYIIQYLEKDFYGVQGLINDIICKSNYVQDFEQDFPPIDGVFLLLNKLCFQPEHKEDIAKKFFFNSKGKVQIKTQTLLHLQPYIYFKETDYHVIAKEIIFSCEDDLINDTFPLPSGLINYVLCKWDKQWVLRVHKESCNHFFAIYQVFFISLSDYDALLTNDSKELKRK